MATELFYGGKFSHFLVEYIHIAGVSVCMCFKLGYVINTMEDRVFFTES